MRTMSTEQDPYARTGQARVQGLGRFLLVGLIVAVALCLYAIFAFRGLQDPAAMEQAVLARNLAAGHGFVTDVLRPLDPWLSGKEAVSAGPVRSLWQAPGYPYLLAGVLRVLQPAHGFTANGLLQAEVQAIVPLGIVLQLVSMVLVWLVARSLYDEARAKVVVAAYAVAWLPLQVVVVGAGQAGLVFLLVLLVVYAALQAIRSSTVAQAPLPTLLWTAASGLAAALLVLTEYAMVVLLVGMAAFLASELQRSRWLGVTCFLLLGTLPLLLWLRTGGLGAYPYLFLHGTSLFPGDQLMRADALSLRAWRVTAAVRAAMADRFMAFVSGKALWQAGVPGLFFVVALFRREEQAYIRTFTYMLLAVLVATPLFPPLPGSSWQAWMGFLPLLVLVGTGAFMGMLAQQEFFDTYMRPFLTVVFIGLCALPTAMGLVRGQQQSPYPPYYGPLQSYVADLVAEEDILVSDIPWATAWYGQQPSLLLPLHPGTVAAKAAPPVGAIYLTGAGAPAPVPDKGHHLWRLMYLDQQIPAEYPFQYAIYLPADTRQQLVLLREDPTQLPQ